MNSGEFGILLIGFGLGALVCGVGIVVLVNVDPLSTIEIFDDVENETKITGIELDDWVEKKILDEQYKANGANCGEAETWFFVHSELYFDTRPELEQSREYRALASEIWFDRMEMICWIK